MHNRLATETSPYLLAHADNPVDWYPWGAEALARARRENKPILLSVGYSACHWCHVMAHESFEDPDTAELMNRWFVNIKVDREERPDLDKIYQVAQQLLTQRAGGWPLTMFLSPHDRQPFFGGTYFPRQASHGLPSFKELLRRVADYHRDHAHDIREHGARLAAAFAELAPRAAMQGPASEAPLDTAPLDAARAALRSSFDTSFGGFGGAPKFPHPENIERCLRDGMRDMATTTLTRMAEGGIYDQLGGGFARYSVDASWTIPHFEKMLYDNGALLGVYATAALATGESDFARIAAETGDFLVRDMRSSEGAFYSSLDADSEGHEGKFYVWSRAEIEQFLTAEEYRAFAPAFGLEQPPNFEHSWHLRVHVRPADPHAAALVDAARAKLLARRNLRVWPARDEKILTAWNALTIKGLALAARHLRRTDFAAAATHAVDFMHRTLWRDGALLATYKDGRAHLDAYLDDYAFLAEALLELLQTRWRSRDLHFAQALTESLLARFEDQEVGGFFFTASDHESLIYRSKTFHDESIPSGNGIAVSLLCRLGVLLGEPRYLMAAERTLRAALPAMQRYPSAHLTLLAALEDYLKPLETVIIRGDAGPELDRWACSLGAVYAPSRMIFAIPADATDLPAAIEQKRALGATVAYHCTGTVCSAPLTTLEAATRALGA